MDKMSPRYKREVPADDMPKAPEMPSLKLCQFSDGKLSIPRDIRQHFMQCPLFGPEWRSIITQFDKDWGVPTAPAPANSQQGQQAAGPANAAKVEAKNEFKMEPFDWSTAFPASPTTLSSLKEKFGNELTEMVGVSPTTSFYLAPGPQLFVVAKDATHIKALEAPIVSHGAGSWLTGDKASKYMANNPDRGIPCKLVSDEIGTVFEDWIAHKITGKKQVMFEILECLIHMLIGVLHPKTHQLAGGWH